MDIVESIDSLVASWKGTRPSWDEYFIGTAILIASRSTCSRLNVGCVIVSANEHKNRIIAAGYNGFLPGAPHTSCIRDGHEIATVHAEQNAISDAARRGVSLNGATAYITHFPCINCAKLLISSGIKAIKYLHDYHNDDLVFDLAKNASVEITKLK
ncbi:MAG: dCMP deaminase [Verrucomicrobiaceae bacterium]|nr:dCMP deaminase [Verrucomicrobiaceae bacterium]